MKEVSTEIFSLEDIYYNDAFTKTGEKLNLEVNDITVDSIISKNNKFGIDSDGNLSVNSISSNQDFNTQICNLIYPVGSIYLSVNAVNPSTLFGGTWEQIKDTFLLACGDNYVNGSTGGEATHTLTVAEIPSHNHDLQIYDSKGSQLDWVLDNVNKLAKYDDRVRIKAEGGGQAHNNMPPYLSVSIWKRTA